MKLKILCIIIYVIFIGTLLEAWARVYYVFTWKTNFFSSPKDIALKIWYPELKQLEQYNYKDDNFNVLLLGGSALNENWGEVPKYFSDKIETDFGKKLNMVNLAVPAHSSLDSLYKYELMPDKKFDLVIFYHGINETRANNVPPRLWRSDYSHYSWYEEINFYFRYSKLNKTGLMLPYFFRHLFTQLKREVVNRNGYVPEHTPRPEWLEYGKSIKTGKSFQKNLRKIIDIAKKKEEPLMVMTFAYYRPKPYEYQDPSIKFTEIWGIPKYVIRGMEIQNSVVRRLAKSGDFIFLDQEKYMGNDNRKFFNDICHFSQEGSEIFAENMLRALNKGVF